MSQGHWSVDLHTFFPPPPVRDGLYRTSSFECLDLVNYMPRWIAQNHSIPYAREHIDAVQVLADFA